ncbi:hypothetical protein ACQR1W_06365 [Bradyrhizobium sp. HKCCYLS1011]|uniref:hypothetical protein n=1 Tax=Bradyrhizobium sp. HKCCYLS1011 TaxID=3420733 RepID=UPI003EBEA559
MALLLMLAGMSMVAPDCRAEDAASDASRPAAPVAGGPTISPSPTIPPAGDASKAATPPEASLNDCAGGEDFKDRLSHSANSPAIVYDANLLPAGNSVDVGLATPIASDAHYFAILLDKNNQPLEGGTLRDDISRRARERKAANTDDLVTRHLLSPGETIVTIDVPTAAAGFWTKRNLFIYQCRGRRPFNVSFMPVHVSPLGWSIAFTILIGVAVYGAAARAIQRVTKLKLTGLQSWNPIRITAGSDNRGSLSTFQVFFFTVLVFVMLAFVLMRTGVLSDLSTTVLELLGISGIGAAAAKGAETSKTAVDPANQAWLLNKGWFDTPNIRLDADPTFFDLISTDGNFDVYRFQSLLFTAAVGGALFIGGVSQLSSFTVPQNILGILGLSQVVYIAGKLVNQSSASQINAVITDLRNAEAEFREAVLTYRPSPGAAVMAPPSGLEEAVNRVGAAAYARYLDKAKAAARLFTSATGYVVDADKLKPSIGALA